MKRHLFLYFLVIPLCLACLLALGVPLLAQHKQSRIITVAAARLAVEPDPARLVQGRYLFATRGCADCHGNHGAGRTLFAEDGMHVVSPNITGGAGSPAAGYRPADWVRTVRDGVKPDGRPVMIMPSEDFSRLSDADMAALMAYTMQLPKIDGGSAQVSLPWRVQLQYAVGIVKDAAEKIDHSVPAPTILAATPTALHGAYVADTCRSCHGVDLGGGKIAGAPASWPAPANLTPGKGGVMARYPTAEVFMATLRSGKRPDGSALSDVMPIGSLKQMNDTDLRALYAYLQTVPPRPAH